MTGNDMEVSSGHSGMYAWVGQWPSSCHQPVHEQPLQDGYLYPLIDSTLWTDYLGQITSDRRSAFEEEGR